jgi:hypothetical protein
VFAGVQSLQFQGRAFIDRFGLPSFEWLGTVVYVFLCDSQCNLPRRPVAQLLSGVLESIKREQSHRLAESLLAIFNDLSLKVRPKRQILLLRCRRMATKLKSETARLNGARSRGPISPEGKQASAQNSLRHGMPSQTIVLEGESKELFEQLLTAITPMNRLNPRDRRFPPLPGAIKYPALRRTF